VENQVKIDIFNHVFPKSFFDRYIVSGAAGKEIGKRMANATIGFDLDQRFRVLDEFPDVRQVITLGQPPIEVLGGPDQSPAIAHEANDGLAENGLRVMALAQRDFDPATFDASGDLLALIADLELMALVGIVDPPRKEAKDAIALCHNAGIRVRMITGDHATTAAAIAGQLGIEGRALTGAEFAAMSDEELIEQLPGIGVIARVAPEDKVRLVRMLQQSETSWR